jgi:hypothetical protein
VVKCKDHVCILHASARPPNDGGDASRPQPEATSRSVDNDVSIIVEGRGGLVGRGHGLGEQLIRERRECKG